jgi:hypothetical protein
VAATAHEFFEKLRAGTADEAACIVIWHLVQTLNGNAKIDIAAPKEGWSLKLRPSHDARYVSLIAEGERSK